MSKLEMVFLMKVSLHLDTMDDVMEFENINKKCSTTIHLLKVNPWFNNKEDIEKFYKIFEQTTCNCNGFEIADSVLLNAERIRNYLFGKNDNERGNAPNDEEPKQRNEDEIHKLKLIIPKVESIKTNRYVSDLEIEILIQNMKPNLKINCDEDFFIEFEQTFRELQVDVNKYPIQIIINMEYKNTFDTVFDLFRKSNQDKIICIWKRNEFGFEAKEFINNSKVKIYFTFIDLEIMEKNKNVLLMLDNEKKNEFSVSSDDLVDKEVMNKYFDLMNKICATKINVLDNLDPYNTKKKHSILRNENIKIKLPECVKEIVADHLSYKHGYCTFKINLPFSLEGIEVLNQNGIFEINEKNDLKVLNLKGVDGIDYIEQKNETNEKEWGIKNSIDYFPKLTKLELRNCANIKMSSNLKNLEYLNLLNCGSCYINIDSKNLKDINLNCSNSKIKLKICRNDIKFIIYDCSFVDIEIECEEEIKPNIEITSCKELKIKSNNEMGNIIIKESNDISFTEGFKCELIQLTNSEITEGSVEAKVVKVLNVSRICLINLNKAKEIVIVDMNNYIFRNKFESCKKLIIVGWTNCKFELGNNQIEEMKVMICKSTNIEGTLPNIKSFISIENNECKIPITSNIITTDEEILELKENIKIVNDKKYLIIRNGKDVECEIELLIKSDITFENCHNVGIKLTNYSFKSYDSTHDNVYTINNKSIGKQIKEGEVDSLVVNNSKNLKINVKMINKMLKIKDSDLFLNCYNGNGITVEKIEIENSNICLVKTISYNKCVIISSKQSLNEIVNHCKELVLKKIKEVDICFENERVKKITFEDCSKIQCYGDLKGKEVKLIKCFDMKLNDTSNSIQIEEITSTNK